MKQGKINFRKITEQDFDEILRVEEESFNSFDKMDSITLSEFFSDFKDGFYVIISDNNITGYCVFFIENGEGYIESIAVYETYRQQGIGLHTLKFIIRCFVKWNIKIINLHVRINNSAAISLYEKEGFVRKKIVEEFYKDGKPAYFYSKNVETLHAD
jgi:[ribosomal protein S18]-alanine N-acetyltransferase